MFSCFSRLRVPAALFRFDPIKGYLTRITSSKSKLATMHWVDNAWNMSFQEYNLRNPKFAFNVYSFDHK